MMNAFKQMLCRLVLPIRAPLTRLACGGLVTLTLALLSTHPQAQTDPLVALQDSVRKWVATQQKVPAENVNFAPFDPRLKVQSCNAPLQMDMPFAAAETVRVRCTQPAWQLYTRISVKGAVLSAAPATPSADKPPQPVLRKVLVAATVLTRGTVLNETHVTLAEADTSAAGAPVFEQVADVMHSEVIRDLRPGSPIRSHDVRPTVLVKRGQMVLLTVGQSQGFQITARVEAMQDGRFGEQVQLKNKESGRLLTGVVKGPNTVQGI